MWVKVFDVEMTQKRILKVHVVFLKPIANLLEEITRAIDGDVQRAWQLRNGAARLPYRGLGVYCACHEQLETVFFKEPLDHLSMLWCDSSTSPGAVLGGEAIWWLDLDQKRGMEFCRHLSVTSPGNWMNLQYSRN